MNVNFYLTGPVSLGNNVSSALDLRYFAHRLFDRAHRRGQLRRLAARLAGRCTALRTLVHLPVGRHSSIANQVKMVPLDRIVGSEGRSEDFDDKFNPLKTHNIERWIAIVAARRSGVVLPPVELVRDGDDYYVRDGHHRISVAKILGQLEIEAVIVN